MLGWLQRPRFADREFIDLSAMLTEDEDRPTYRRDLLLQHDLDFSLDSLRHIDDYLALLHRDLPNGHDLMRVVLRTGAYVGEVMRKLQPGVYRWILHAEAAKHSPLVKSWGPSLGTAGILWRSSESMCFPLGKVAKFLENGREDSVYAFANVLTDTANDPARSL